MPEDFLQQVLKAFAKIRKVIDTGSSEHDIRERIVSHLIKKVLGYSGKEYQIEKKRTDLTIFDENGFRIIVIETKRLDVDIDRKEWKDYAFKYADGTTRYVCLTNGVKIKLWEIIGKGKDKSRVDLDFDAILGHKRLEKISSSEKSQILFLDNLKKEVLWDESKYMEFDKYYGQIDVKEQAGFNKLIERLDYILNNLLMSYTINAFEKYHVGYSHFLSEVSKIEKKLKAVRNNKEIANRYERAKRRLEVQYEQYLPFKGYDVWRKFSNRENMPEEENKQVFCKETIYVMLNKLLFIRICEDTDLLPKNISNGGIESLKSHLLDPEKNYKDILNIAYRTAGKLYSHFYELGILDWYVEGDGELNRVLNRTLWTLNRFNFEGVDRDILGKLYEKYLPRAERKALGEFYTPDEVIDFILDSVGFTAESPIEGKDLLDPACGSGGFLVRALNRLIIRYQEKGLEAEEILDNIADQIYGFDINPFACHIAEMNLLFRIIDLYQKAKKENPEYRLKRFKIYQTDSLEPPQLQKEMMFFIQSAESFVKEREELAKIKGKKFDYVVGNPPYIRSKSLSKRDAYRNLHSTAYGSFDIYTFFLEDGIRRLKIGGKLGFITSNKYFEVDYGKKLRPFILNNSRIELIIDLSKCDVFEVPLIETAIIVLERITKDIIEKEKIRKKPHYSIPMFRLEQNNLSLLSSLDTSKDVTAWKLPVKSFLESIDNRFEIRVSDESKKILSKLDIGAIPLGELGELRGGIMGFNYWDMEKNVTDDQPDNTEYLRVITPTHIRPYRVQWKKKAKLFGKVFHHPYLKYDQQSVTETTWDFFKKKKILIRGVARMLTAAYDARGYAVLVAVFALTSPKYNPNYIIGLLNSKLMDFFHKSTYRARIPKGSLRYPKSFLQNIPIRIPAKSKDKAKADAISKKVSAINRMFKSQMKYKRIKRNFKLLLGKIKTTKLSKYPKITFNIGHGNLSQIRRVKDTVFLNLVDSIKCNDNLVAEYIEYYLKASQDKLSSTPNVRTKILNLQIPIEENEIARVVRRYKSNKRLLKKIPTRIENLKKQIDNLVYELYRVSKAESAFIEKTLASFG